MLGPQKRSAGENNFGATYFELIIDKSGRLPATGAPSRPQTDKVMRI
jgi:hypothetical protein